jgi:hypothetical protein
VQAGDPVVGVGEVGTEALEEALGAIGVREQQPADPRAVAAQEARGLAEADAAGDA